MSGWDVSTQGAGTMKEARKKGGKENKNSRTGDLLQALIAAVGDHQRFEDGQDLPAVFDDALDDFTGLGHAQELALPLGENFGRHVDVAPQLFGRVPA